MKSVKHTIEIKILSLDGIKVYDLKRPASSSRSRKSHKNSSAPSSSSLPSLKKLNKISAIASLSRNKKLQSTGNSLPLQPTGRTASECGDVDGSVRYMAAWDPDVHVDHGEENGVGCKVVLETNLHSLKNPKQGDPHDPNAQDFEAKTFEVMFGLERKSEFLVFAASVLTINSVADNVRIQLPLYPVGKASRANRGPGSNHTSEIAPISFVNDTARKFGLARDASVLAVISVSASTTYLKKQLQRMSDNVITMPTSSKSVSLQGNGKNGASTLPGSMPRPQRIHQGDRRISNGGRTSKSYPAENRRTNPHPDSHPRPQVMNMNMNMNMHGNGPTQVYHGQAHGPPTHGNPPNNNPGMNMRDMSPQRNNMSMPPGYNRNMNMGPGPGFGPGPGGERFDGGYNSRGYGGSQQPPYHRQQIAPAHPPGAISGSPQQAVPGHANQQMMIAGRPSSRGRSSSRHQQVYPNDMMMTMGRGRSRPPSRSRSKTRSRSRSLHRNEMVDPRDVSARGRNGSVQPRGDRGRSRGLQMKGMANHDRMSRRSIQRNEMRRHSAERGGRSRSRSNQRHGDRSRSIQRDEGRDHQGSMNRRSQSRGRNGNRESSTGPKPKSTLEAFGDLYNALEGVAKMARKDESSEETDDDDYDDYDDSSEESSLPTVPGVLRVGSKNMSVHDDLTTNSYALSLAAKQEGRDDDTDSYSTEYSSRR